jgi:hypothetical protein
MVIVSCKIAGCGLVEIVAGLAVVIGVGLCTEAVSNELRKKAGIPDPWAALLGGQQLIACQESEVEEVEYAG